VARVELNIVALGDFTSVNTQIKALQTQIDLLNKSVVGVGLGNSLTKDLNSASAAFKNTMLSTGQFTQSQVQLTTETQKFGKALESGKLSLGTYYNIIKQNSGTAMNSVKALAIEQTKLQNSVIMADPTKKGFYSVFTPTTINKIADATKIAANEQNIYNIAVEKGTQSLINWGKNTQWAGRQLTVGMTVPLMLFANQATSAFKDVNVELTRLQRLYGEGLMPPSQTEINQISAQVTDLGKNVASSMGIAVKDTVQVAANFAAMGRQGQNLLDTTYQTQRLSKLGAVDATAATNTVVALQNVYKVSTTQLADAVNFLSDIQKQTTMTLGDMTEAIPRVGPIMQQLGGSYKDTAVMLVAMREAGIPAAQAANAVKSAIASLIAPTKGAVSAAQQFGISLDAVKNAGSPVQMIEKLQEGLKGLSPLAKEQVIEKIFGKFQFARVSALLANFGQIGSQTQNALKIAGASSAELANLANQEMKQATESPTAKYQRAIETFKADLIPVGQKIIEITTSLMNFGNSVAKIFSGLPAPIKSVLGIAAIGTVLAGPIIMLTGLMANFVGYITKAAFSLKQLVTGGTTLRQLLTPQIIASQQAADLFSKGILGDVDSVDLLNQAIKNLTVSMEGLVSSMNTGTGIAGIAQEVAAIAEPGLAGGRVPFKAPGLASGGFIPGSGNTDSFPAMLMPGEAVIPKGPAQKYQSFISAMIDGKLPGFMSGSSGVYYGGTRRGKPSTERPSELQGVAETSLSQYGVPGEQAKLAALTEQLGAKYNLSPSQMSNISGAHLLNLAHVAPAQYESYKGTERKVWDVNNLRVSSGAENKAHEYLGRQESFTNAITQAGAMQGPAGIAAAEAINAGKQPMSKLEQSIFIEAVNSIEKQVKEGKLKDMPSFKTGYVARDIMIARNAGNQGLSSDISSLVVDDPSVAKAVAKNKASGAKIGKAVTDSLNKELEVNSPSAKTQKTGKAVADGLRLGIEENAGQVKAAAAELGQSVSTTIEEETLGKSGAPNGGLFGRLKNMTTNESGKMNIQSKMALSGGLMMGGGMLAGMLPKGSNASNITQSTSSMAGMGAMFGTWGIAAGAALGLVTGGIGALMKAEKEHAATAKATFSSSADAVQLFGGTVTSAANPMAVLGSAIMQANPSLSQLQTNMKNISDAIKTLPADNPLVLVVKAMSSTTATNAASIAKSFVTAQMAINGIDSNKAEQMYQALLGVSKHPEAIGTKSGLPTSTTSAVVDQLPLQVKNSSAGIQAMGKDYGQIAAYGTSSSADAANSKIKDLFETFINLDATSKQYSDTLKGLQDKSINNTAALNYLSGAYETSNKTLSDQIIKLNQHGATLAQVAQLFKDAGLKGSEIPSQIIDEMKKNVGAIPTSTWNALFQEIIAQQKITNTTTINGNNGGGGGGGGSGGGNPVDQVTLLNKKYKDLINQDNKRISALEKTNKLMNDQNQAAQDAVNLATQQTDIQNQIRQAMAGGDYLKANLLRQNMLSNQDSYNQKIAQNANQQTIDTLKQNLADFQDQISQGSDPGSKAAAALKAGINNAKFQSYQVGSVNMPSAVQYGSSAQMGSAPASMPQINLVVNANGLTTDQAKAVATAAVTDALTKAGITSGASARLKSIGG
jgi:TP901 family phage tail tape measure protein